MKTILDDIIEYKKHEIAQRVKREYYQKIKEHDLFLSKTNSLANAFEKEKKPHIIAEFKRKSPSKGWINQSANIEKIVEDYIQGGASAVSILTDTYFFGGDTSDITKARTAIPNIPILRKDFIIDIHQIEEAKAIGADMILLIANCLSKNMVDEFAHSAKELGLEVLFEIHSIKEFEEKYSDRVDFVGINNRDLKTFQVDIQTSEHIIRRLPTSLYTISESGLKKHADIKHLFALGFNGFLIGETLMSHQTPSTYLKKLIR